MNKLKITFLGTGSSIPTPKRRHPAILLSFGSENILLDCGEGTQTQLRKAKISPHKITKILLTHKHGDHILGLPGLFQTLTMQDHQKELPIYGPKKISHILDLIKKLVNHGLKTKTFEVSGKFIDTPEYHIEASPMSHGTPTNAYSITFKERKRLDRKKIKKLKLPNTPLLKNLLEGKTIKHNGKTIKPSQVVYKEPSKKITVILDTEPNKNAEKFAKNSDLLICESSFLSEVENKAQDYKHLTAKQAATIAKRAKVKKLILTHLSQRYDKDDSQVLKEAKSIFSKTSIAKDLDTLEI